MRRNIFCFLGLTLFALLLHAQTDEEPSGLSSISASEKQFFLLVVEGNNRFAFDCYHKMKNKPGNICFSSYSVVASLALAAVGAKGETAQQFQHAFRYPSSLLPLLSDLNEFLRTPSSNARGASQVLSSNAIWLQKDLSILPAFKLTLQRSFKYNLQLLDFANQLSQSVDKVNQWTSQQTNGKIRNLLMKQDVTRNSRFIVTSAIYMTGQWAHPFNQSATKRLPFRYSPQRTSMADMMHQTADILLLKGEKWDLLTLPYVQGSQGAQLAMTIILPKTVDISELEKELTLANWKQWLSQLQMETVSVVFPRFRIEERLDLEMILKQLGLTSMFNPDADFSGITGKKELFINHAVHKSMIRIDEKGMEAPSPSAVSTPSAAKKEKPYEFLADHPFIFVIWDQKSHSILLMGRLSLP